MHVNILWFDYSTDQRKYKRERKENYIFIEIDNKKRRILDNITRNGHKACAMHIAHGKSRCVEASAYEVTLNIIHGADIDGHQQLFFPRLFAGEQVFGQNFQRTNGLHGSVLVYDEINGAVP